MDRMQKSPIVSPFEDAEDIGSSLAVKSDDTSTQTMPTIFRRNHGLTVRGLKLIFDPSAFLAFDLRKNEKCQTPPVEGWHTAGRKQSPHEIDSDLTPPDTSVVRCKQSLNPGEDERNSFKLSHAWAEVQNSHPLPTERKNVDKGDASHLTEGVIKDLSRAHPFGLIPRNRAGQRVDPPVDFDKDLRTKMQKERWCSNYHLKGLCPIRDCYFKHGSLDEAGKNALLSLTRGNYCRNGNGCDEENCYAGHQCPYDPCTKEENCHFPPEMHVLDKQIVYMDVLLLPKSSRPRSCEERRQREGKG